VDLLFVVLHISLCQYLTLLYLLSIILVYMFHQPCDQMQTPMQDNHELLNYGLLVVTDLFPNTIKPKQFISSRNLGRQLLKSLLPRIPQSQGC